jgi:hypothetical protein
MRTRALPVHLSIQNYLFRFVTRKQLKRRGMGFWKERNKERKVHDDDEFRMMMNGIT